MHVNRVNFNPVLFTQLQVYKSMLYLLSNFNFNSLTLKILFRIKTWIKLIYQIYADFNIT